MKILHLITDLNQGGAEIMLSRVLPELEKKGAAQHVICMSGEGIIADDIARQGFSVTFLNMRRSRPSLSAFATLIRSIRQYQPDILQTWLYHADLYGSLAAILTGTKIVWGLHNSTLGENANPITKIITRSLAFLSRFIPRAIISCSREAIHVHQSYGYPARGMRFVPNGFDTEKFSSDPVSREKTRARLCIEKNQILLANISRFDQQKNHRGLIRAWGLVAKSAPNVRFLLAGKGLDESNSRLIAWLEEESIFARTILLGIRRDVPDLLNAMDIMVLSSNSGEAFPLIIGEAMSCAKPCVVTDIGDCAFLVSDCGLVSKINDDQALANQCLKLIELAEDERIKLGVKARERIEKFFSIAEMGEAYFEIYQSVVQENNKSKF